MNATGVVIWEGGDWVRKVDELAGFELANSLISPSYLFRYGTRTVIV